MKRVKSIRKTKKNSEKEKKFFSKKSIEDALNYIKESRNYIYFGIAIFVLFATFGFFYSSELTFLNEYLQKIFISAENKKGLDLFYFIFLNNLGVGFYNIFLGFLLGVFPLINSLINGTILGYVFSIVNQTVGPIEFWRILPHGIFELPAIFIAIGIGLKNGLLFINYKKGELKRRFILSFKVFIFAILPLLFVAAIIETLLITFVK